MAAVPSVDAGIIFNTRATGADIIGRCLSLMRVLFLIPVIPRGWVSALVPLVYAGIIFNTRVRGRQYVVQ